MYRILVCVLSFLCCKCNIFITNKQILYHTLYIYIIQEFGTFSFIDNDEIQVFCHSKKEAIRGLYHALSQQKESEN